MSMNPIAWLKCFRSREDRSCLHGESLYRYRCSDREFEELQSLLSCTVLETGAECGCFALFAAEWLRRQFEGGSWTWTGIFDALDSPLAHPPYDRLEGTLKKYWGLEVIRLNGNRQFLSTLLVQGGLPLRVVEREGNTLRTLFGRLLHEALATPISREELVELAQHWARSLPQSWRDPAVYRLLAEITEVTARLSAEIPEDEGPVEFLDEHQPGWRAQLPMSVTEEVGHALFSTLVEKAHEAIAVRRAPLRIRTRLLRDAAGWQLVRQPLIPATITRQDLAVVLGLDQGVDLPYRIELHVQGERADDRHLATATQWKKDKDEIVYLLDSRMRSRALRLAGELNLFGVSGSATFGPAPLDGGVQRGPLPWVFRPVRDEEGAWDMVAQGSVRLRSDRALLLLDSGSAVHTDDGREHEALALIENRSLYALRGTARVLANGELCRIALGAERDSIADYALSGQTLYGLGNPEQIFRGPPELRASAVGERYTALVRGTQQWRRPGERWSSDIALCLGRIELRHVIEDETMHVRRGVHVVPATFAYDAKPDRAGKSGRLSICGLAGAVTAELVGHEAFTATKLEAGRGRREWAIAAIADGVPRHARLRINWDNAATSELLLPLPIADARFVTVDGGVLSDEANVALGSAHRVVAEVVGAPALVREARLILRLHDHHLGARQRNQLGTCMPLRRVPGQDGVARLELSRIIDEIRLRFAGSQRPEARVELELELQGHTRVLRIQRFVCGIRFERETHEIVAEAEEGVELRSLEVESFPVDQPGAQAHVHEATARGRWPVEEGLLRRGARLVVGRIDGRASTSTLLLRRPREDEDDAEAPPEQTLAGAARAKTLSERERMFTAVLDRLEHDLRDPDWRLLDQYVRTLGDLHASTFDVLEALITRPRLCVL
jgi:hypothetical protein